MHWGCTVKSMELHGLFFILIIAHGRVLHEGMCGDNILSSHVASGIFSPHLAIEDFPGSTKSPTMHLGRRCESIGSSNALALKLKFVFVPLP